MIWLPLLPSAFSLVALLLFALDRLNDLVPFLPSALSLVVLLLLFALDKLNEKNKL